MLVLKYNREGRQLGGGDLAPVTLWVNNRSEKGSVVTPYSGGTGGSGVDVGRSNRKAGDG